MGPAALAAAVAVVPGLLTWAWGRSLLRAADDPTLPERVLAWRNRSTAAFAAGAAILVVLLPRHATWGLGLLVLGRLTGGFPARRVLFDERWDLVAYLAHVVRLILGVGGFWVVLLLAPALVSWARPHVWPVALALALVLAAWGFAYSPVLLKVTGATPLARPDLEPRLREIASRSTSPMPRLWVVGHPDGRMVNALALPHTRTPSVVFSRTLVEVFEPDEVGAVFAHEQAHLEHFDPRRLMRLAVLQLLGVLLGTVGAAAVLARLQRQGAWVILAWPVLLMVIALFRLVRHRAHEAESDRRAVELCGDPDALARALVKLHALALLPRRMAVELESRATHPSLANRLRAIEERPGAADRPGPGLDGASPGVSSGAPPELLPVALQGADAGAWVILDARRVHWLEGVPEGTPGEPEALQGATLRMRSLAYSELVELRLEPRGRAHALLAADRAGVRWTLPLAAGEAAAAHEALNAVDQRLAPPSAARPERKLLGAIVACAGAIVALVAGSATLLPALLAVVLPHPGPLAAFGTAALTTALLSLVSGAVSATPFQPGLTPLGQLGLVVCGAAALWIARTTAWRERAGRTRTAPWIALLLALVGLAFLSLPSLALLKGEALPAHVAARDHPGGALLLIASAAALVVVPRRWARVTATTTGVIAVVALFLGSRAFADRFVQDPFFAPGLGGDAPTVVLELVDEEALPAASGQLELSPSGESWAVRRFEVGDQGEPPVSRMIVGSTSGPQHAYDVGDLKLLSDTLLVVLLQDGDRTAVELRPHDPAEPAEWRVELDPLLEGAQLAAHRVTGAWRVSGTHPESGAFVRATGRPDGSFTVDRWDPGTTAAAWVGGDGPAVLGVAPRFGALDHDSVEEDWEEDPSPLWWLMAGPLAGSLGSRVVALDADGARELCASQLFVQCDAAPPGDTRPLCRANDGSRTALWRVDPAVGERRVVAAVEGLAWSAQPGEGGWLLTVSVGTNQDLYRLEDDGLVRLEIGNTPPWIQATASYEGGVGVLVTDRAGRPVLRRYARP